MEDRNTGSGSKNGGKSSRSGEWQIVGIQSRESSWLEGKMIELDKFTVVNIEPGMQIEQIVYDPDDNKLHINWRVHAVER